ncbi:hypothetical protein ACFXGI_21050 [Streptomyces sp. NPDC059355]|uniref:hypothetical protein n=1 Tax=Streptomyces sp. NPDC059355 TaxID=3346811 RepID=UPI00368418CF
MAAAPAVLPSGAAHAFNGGNHEDITRAAPPWQPVTLTAMADAHDGAIDVNDRHPCFGVGPPAP